MCDRGLTITIISVLASRLARSSDYRRPRFNRLFDRCGRAGDTSIVDQNIEATQRGSRFQHHVLDIGVSGHVAVACFTKTLSMQLGGYGIRANAIPPGFVEGPRMRRVLAGRASISGKSIENELQDAMRTQSLKYTVNPDDVAALAVFLAADAARPNSGQMLPIDHDMRQG